MIEPRFFRAVRRALAVLLLGCPAFARWATENDAETAIEREDVLIKVKADGTYTVESDKQLRILKDAARQAYGTMRFSYNSRAASFKVLEAKTITDKKDYPVEPRMIEDKPLASQPYGFDQYHQVLVAFPEVRVGSRIRVRTIETVREVPLPGIFTSDFVFGYYELQEAARIRIESPLPLYFEKNDPDDKVAASLREEKKRWILELALKAPIYKRPMDETDPYLDGSRIAWIDVSTTKDWSTLARAVTGRYEEILSAPLPDVFERIAADAGKKTALVDKINAASAALADEMHYMGDWRPIRGGHVPRPLKEIARTRHGDCKDFAAALSAILRRMGMEANVAWVERGYRILITPNHLPFAYFNHAIVFAQAGGRNFWLDATNRASFAQGIPEDIIDRPALVLNAKTPALVWIPAADPRDSVLSLRQHADMVKEGEIATKGTMTMSGRAAFPLAGIGLDESTETVRYGLIQRVARTDRLRQWNISGDDLRSRITHDLGFDYDYREDGPDLHASAGDGYFLPGGFVSAFQIKVAGRVSDLFLGQPWTFRRRLTLDRVRLVGRRNLACAIDSPWIKAERKVVPASSDIVVSDEFVLKKSKILNREIESAEFIALRERLRRCFDRAAVIYRRVPAPR